MVTTNSVSSFKTRRTILVAAAAMATIGLIFELIDPVPGWFVRVLVDLIVIGIALWEVFHEARADFLAQVVIGLFGTLSILDSALGTDLSTLDPATTLALLVLMAVIYAATKSGESPVPVIVVSVFIALYWVLLSAVELRHAPWIGWIHDLSAPDPWFILPVVYAVTAYLQVKLSPTPISDPVQAKVMQFMPVAFSIMFLFFPAGLVLYWLVNNLLQIAQQWQMNKMLEREAAVAAAKRR